MGCTRDADCADGEACCDGQCKPARSELPVGGCTYDGECGGGDCRDGLCHAACMTSGQCGTGDICEGAFCQKNDDPVVVCVFNEACGPGHVCINATCHRECDGDAGSANPADFCDDGICRPDWRRVSECTIDRDCQNAGEQCVDGQCRTRCMQDLDCATCVDGPTCVMGYCQEVEG
jgi:hypothetical protein